MIIEPCCVTTKLIPHFEKHEAGHVITNGDVPLHLILETIISNWKPTLIALALPFYDLKTMNVLKFFISHSSKQIEIIVHRQQLYEVIHELKSERTTIATQSSVPPTLISCMRENKWLTITGDINHARDQRQHILSYSVLKDEYELMRHLIISPTIRLKRVENV